MPDQFPDDLLADPPIFLGVTYPRWVDAYARFGQRPTDARREVDEIFRAAREAATIGARFFWQLEMVIPLAYADPELAASIRETLVAAAAYDEPEVPPEDWPDTEADWLGHRAAMAEDAARWRRVLEDLNQYHAAGASDS